MYVQPGERIILTGYADKLEVRMEPFMVEGMLSDRYLTQVIEWAMIQDATFDLVEQVILSMREKLKS